MPLKEVQEASIDADDMTYILFFASGAPPWCPDCREALPAIESVFGKEDAPLLQVIKVGLREEWKSASNRWRGEPFQVTETPCIIKFVNSKEVKRLGDQACKSVQELKSLVAAT